MLTVVVAVKVDNDQSKQKMSKLGTEAQLLARLMEQARKAKREAAGSREVVIPVEVEGSEQPVPIESDEDVPLRVRMNQKKRKAPVSSSTVAATAPIGLPPSDAVTTTRLSVGGHVTAPAKKTKVVTAGPGEARPSKLSLVAREAQLDDEGFLRHVAKRLRSAGLDRMVQAQGSPRENRARAFDSVLRGLHNLYLVDSLEEDLRLKEQVATLEADLLVEQTERENACRQRDNIKAKLEKAVGEKTGALARVTALEEENAQLKAKIAELPHVVAQERKAAAEEALAAFMSSMELADIRKEEYRRGYDAGYEKHFNTLIEKDWINVEKYYADMERESAAIQGQDPGPSTEVTEHVVGGEPETKGIVSEGTGDEERTPVRGPEGVTPVLLKPNGDPLNPGLTPASGSRLELD